MINQLLRSTLYPPAWVYVQLTGGRDPMAKPLARMKKMGLEQSKVLHAMTLIVQILPDVDWDNKKTVASEVNRFLDSIERNALDIAKNSQAVPNWSLLHNQVLELAVSGFYERLQQ